VPSKDAHSKALEDSTRAFQKGLAAHNKSAVEFVQTELELALTFCDFAKGAAADSSKRIRNVENARRAYAGAMYVLQKLALPEDQKSRLEQLADKVHTFLACLPD
jgi:hypothetical protein